MPYKDGKTWRATRMIDGKRKSRRFPTKQKALEWEASQNAAVWEEEKQDVLNDLIPTVSVRDWADATLDYVKECEAPATYDEKQYAFKRLVKRLGGDFEVESITPALILNHLKAERRERSPNAANKDRKCLSSSWKWATINVEGFPVVENPFRISPRFKEKRTPRHIPAESDFWAVYEMAEPQDKAMLACFIYLAARKTEIFRLTWSCVDLVRERIRLSTVKTSDGSEKLSLLPIVPELKTELLAHWERSKDRSGHVFRIPPGPKFSNPFAGQPYTSRQHYLGKMCTRAEVTRFDWHSIRHLSASILFKAGHKVGVIQRILRHENPQTTVRYLHDLGFDPEMEEAMRITFQK
ncbi:tyrosine-type recombinase/integrase [Oceanidesulfovibrio marinus]|uniref:Site-specific integrase n=1 Tax=Oceanidesulfovibrio marinus TaxID=370038 RepID=A0A6P1ZKN0_9BACT|nr:site-specific integrase [Oceanidesulfovibrio marinus]TVM35654.1 site-specific integrase [Oceanidesulfovibrio marinus]